MPYSTMVLTCEYYTPLEIKCQQYNIQIKEVYNANISCAKNKRTYD